MVEMLDTLLLDDKDDKVVELADSDDLGWFVVGSNWVVAGW
ncbi:hypothetical protein [Actinomyces israelii]|nr:hypothetical protein [Actinomyces israelii]WKR22809.1 hypothetical protein AIF0345_2765 [Actinomyces israelii]